MSSHDRNRLKFGNNFMRLIEYENVKNKYREFDHTGPLIHLGRERHCKGEVSCPAMQHNVP